MEDLSRNVAQDAKIADHRRSVKRSAWTLILVGELGKIVSFRLSKPLLVGFTLCFAAICYFVVFATISYYRIRSENITLRNDFDDVKADLVMTNKAKEGALVRLMLLEPKTKPDKKLKQRNKKKKLASVSADIKDAPRKAKPDKKRDASVSDKKPQLIISEAAKPPAAASEGTQGAVPKEVKPQQETSIDEATDTAPVETASFEGISVEGPEIWPTAEGTAVKFKFSLRNIDPEGKKIRGHTFVVLEPEEGSKEPARVSPWSPLQDGKPTMFKRGQYFGIARFKYVGGTFPDMQDVQRFKTATIYVYSESGELLVQEVYEVDKILRS